jgi:hypothetical protein
MEVNLAVAGVILALFVVVTLSIFESRRSENLRCYRSKVTDSHRLMYVCFQLHRFPDKKPEYYIRGAKIKKEEEPFVLEDMKALEKMGIQLQVEHVDHNHRLIPDTPEFRTRLRDYEEVLLARERRGQENLARSKVVAPYAYRREYYIPASRTRPARAKAHEPTFM